MDPTWLIAILTGIYVMLTGVYAIFTYYSVQESKKSREAIWDLERKRMENKKIAVRRIISEELLTNFKILIRIGNYVYNYVDSILKDMEVEERKRAEANFEQLRKIEEQDMCPPLLLEPRGKLPGDTDLQKLFIYAAKVKIPEYSAYKSIINSIGFLEKNEIKIITRIYAELKEIGAKYSLIPEIYHNEEISIKSEASQNLINEMKDTRKLCLTLHNIYKRFFNNEINEEKLEEEIEFLLKG